MLALFSSAVSTFAANESSGLSGGAIAGIVIGVIAALIIGALIGYFVAMHIFKKQLKKNPPISKDTIKMIYASCGRKPSEQQINDIYKRAMSSTNSKNK